MILVLYLHCIAYVPSINGSSMVVEKESIFCLFMCLCAKGFFPPSFFPLFFHPFFLCVCRKIITFQAFLVYGSYFLYLSHFFCIYFIYNFRDIKFHNLFLWSLLLLLLLLWMLHHKNDIKNFDNTSLDVNNNGATFFGPFFFLFFFWKFFFFFFVWSFQILFLIEVYVCF